MIVFVHKSDVQSGASVTPKRASSTSAIWWFDNAHYQRASAREDWRESGCGRLLDTRADRTAHVAERAARGARGRPPGTAAGGGRRHTGAGTHTPARRHDARARARPEERHCALSQPSLNEHTARHPPHGTNSIRERCCRDGRRLLHSFVRDERYALFTPPRSPRLPPVTLAKLIAH